MKLAENDVKMRILLAAKKLFAKHGFDGTSVRQICEEASANVALVSYHFGGKEKVFEAIFEEFFPAKEDDFLRYEGEFKDPTEGLRFLIHGIISFTIQDKELSDIVNQELTMQSPRTVTVLTYINPVWLKVRELLERGKAKNVFHFESASATLLMIFGVAISHKRKQRFEGLLLEDVFSSDLDIPQDYADQAVDFIMKGLGVDPS